MFTGIAIAGTLAVLGALYLVASPRFGERAYHYALFAPWKYPIGNYDGELGRSGRYEDIFFNAINGKKLHGWFFQGSEPKTILLNHGKTGNITDLERLIILLCETGASVFIYDYRGFGRSEGAPSLKVICEDGVSAYNWLVETKKVAPANIVAYGESLGGGVACHLANHTDVGALILQSAFCSLREISIENMSALRYFPELLFPIFFKNSRSVSAFKKPLLLLHGALDEDIHIKHSHKLLAAANDPKNFVILPNTLHDEISEQDSELFVHTVKEFLSNLDSARSSSQPAPHTVNS
jgi:alpha-beta hydrolase superfamily lysophospholipase